MTESELDKIVTRLAERLSGAEDAEIARRLQEATGRAPGLNIRHVSPAPPTTTTNVLAKPARPIEWTKRDVALAQKLQAARHTGWSEPIGETASNPTASDIRLAAKLTEAGGR